MDIYEIEFSDGEATPLVSPRTDRDFGGASSSLVSTPDDEYDSDHSFSSTSESYGSDDDDEAGLATETGWDESPGRPVKLEGATQEGSHVHGGEADVEGSGKRQFWKRNRQVDLRMWSQLLPLLGVADEDLQKHIAELTANQASLSATGQAQGDAEVMIRLLGELALSYSRQKPAVEQDPAGLDSKTTKRRPPTPPPPKLTDRKMIKSYPDSVWNQRFQELVSLPDSEAKFHKLGYLAHDFEHAAETYGKIIISERFMPVSEKTIKPIDLGGIAGGDKFIIRGILFKFAVDTQLAGGLWMYGNDVPMDGCAMKAVTLVDYRGFRLMAVSLLPVSKHTICYGSRDGGKTVHTDYPAFNRQFEAIFRRLNLKLHKVGNRHLRGPGDIEGHWGVDGTLYLLDFGRLYPPESPLLASEIFPPVAHQRAVFFKMLRPELVGTYDVPLCSDAFTAWLRSDPNASVHNKEVHEATAKLLRQLIPALAEEVNLLSLRDRERYLDLRDVHKGNIRVMLFKPDKSGSKQSSQPILIVERNQKYTAVTTGTDVSALNKRLLHVLHLMHRRGINMRYLGQVRHHLARNSKQEDFGIYMGMLFTEMAARVCKNMIRALLRGKMRELRVPSSEPYKQLLLCLFNHFSGHSTSSHNFWTTEEKQIEGTLEFYIYQVTQELFPKSASPRHSVTTPALVVPPSYEGKSTPVSMKSPNGLLSPRLALHLLSSALPPCEGQERGKRGYTMHRLFKDRPSINVEYEKLSNLDKVFVKKLLPIKSAIRVKFGNNALEESEWAATTRAKPFLFQGLFFRRLCDMLGVQLADDPNIFEILNGDPPPAVPRPFKFMEPHVVDMIARKKPMHLVASSEGFALYMKGMDIYKQAKSIIGEGLEKKLEKRRKMDNVVTVMRFAREKLEEAILQVPDSYHTLVYLGKTEHWLALEGHAYRVTASSQPNVEQTATGTAPVAADAVKAEQAASNPNAMIQHEYYQSAVKHLQQALEISKLRDRVQLSKSASARNGGAGPTRLSADDINLSLLLAQVLCDWSVSEGARLKDTIRAEKQDSLWMRAWTEYKNLVKHSDWAQTKEAFLGDIKEVMDSKVGVDSATTEAAEDVGQLVMALMKIEIIVENELDDCSSLDLLLGPPPSRQPPQSKPGNSNGGQIRPTDLQPQSQSQPQPQRPIDVAQPREQSPAVVVASARSSSGGRGIGSPSPQRPVTEMQQQTPLCELPVPVAARREEVIGSNPRRDTIAQAPCPPQSPSRSSAKTQYPSVVVTPVPPQSVLTEPPPAEERGGAQRVATRHRASAMDLASFSSAFTLVEAASSTPLASSPQTPTVRLNGPSEASPPSSWIPSHPTTSGLEVSTETAASAVRLRRRSSDGSPFDPVALRERLHELVIPEPCTTRRRRRSSFTTDDIPNLGGDDQATGGGAGGGEVEDGHAVISPPLATKPHLQQLVSRKPRRPSSAQLTKNAVIKNDRSSPGEIKATPTLQRGVTLNLLTRRKAEQPVKESEAAITKPAADDSLDAKELLEETDGIERVIREEVCLVSPDGRYLCVSALDGSISMQPCLQTSSTLVLEYVTDILKEGNRREGGGDTGGGGGGTGGQPPITAPATGSGLLQTTSGKKLFGIRVAYNGTYLCTDENGHMSVENIILRKNQLRRFGRWEWIEEERSRREREKEKDERAKGRRRANRIVSVANDRNQREMNSPDMAGALPLECRGTIRHTGGSFLRYKKNSGELITSKKQPARVWVVRALRNKVYLRACDNGSHLYCATTGQVGLIGSNSTEPNTWFIHLLPRVPPRVPVASSETPAKQRRPEGAAKRNQAHVHYVAIQSYMGAYLGVDEASGNLIAKPDNKPFKWRLEEVVYDDDDSEVDQFLKGSERERTPTTPTTTSRYFTLSAKVAKESKKYWLYCANGKLTLVATPSTVAFTPPIPKFFKWLVRPYDARWTDMLSRLYAQLSALHSHRAALALSAGIFKGAPKDNNKKTK